MKRLAIIAMLAMFGAAVFEVGVDVWKAVKG